MLIATSDGQGFCYEVLEGEDGFLVRMRDLETGELDEQEIKLFRTAAVAFAYAELSAAFDCYATAQMIGDEAAETLLVELNSQKGLFEELSQRLGDEALNAQMIVAWEQRAIVRHRRCLH